MVEAAARSLPSGWRWVKTEDVCEIQLGKMLSPAAKMNTRPRRYLRNANVLWNRLDLSDLLEMDFSEVEEHKFELRAGDVLVCEGGEPGRAAVWQEELSQCFFQKALARLRAKQDRIDPHFLVFRLWAGSLAGEFTESHGRTTIAHLPAIRLARLPIPLPPLEEQKRITRVLRQGMVAVERARAAAEAQLEAAKSLQNVYLRRAFHGITPLSVGDIRNTPPPGWRWVLLNELARLESGHTPSRRHPEWWGGPIPWISLTDIRGLDGRVAYETREYTNEAGIANSAARVLARGTVVLSRTASVGFVTIMGREMATSQDFVNWVCGPDLEPQFLAFLLRVARSYVRSLSSGAIHQTVYMPTVEAFTACVPALVEQRRITTVLNEQLGQVELFRRTACEQLEVIAGLPGSLLRRAFGRGL